MSYIFFWKLSRSLLNIICCRDIRNSAKIEHVIQVQLRFCLLDTTCEQEDQFPPNISVKVNNKICALPVGSPLYTEYKLVVIVVLIIIIIHLIWLF